MGGVDGGAVEQGAGRAGAPAGDGEREVQAVVGEHGVEGVAAGEVVDDADGGGLVRGDGLGRVDCVEREAEGCRGEGQRDISGYRGMHCCGFDEQCRAKRDIAEDKRKERRPTDIKGTTS